MKEKSIEKVAVLNIIKSLSATLFPMITFAYVSRILNPDGWGKVTFARTYISYFAMLAGMGISIYGGRECAKYRGDKEKFSKTVQELCLINLISLVCSYVLLFLSVLGINEVKARKEEIMLMSLIMLGQTLAVEWLYSALEEYRYITIRSILVHSFSLALVLIAIRSSEDILKYVFILVFVEVVIGLVNLVHAKRYIFLKKYSEYNFKQHIKPMLYFFTAAVSSNLFTNSDALMLGFLSNNYEIGLYAAGTKICTMVFTVVSAFAISIMPRLSFYFSSKNDREYKELINKTYDYLMLLTIPASIGMMMLAKDIVILISGDEYVASGIIAQIMAPGIIAYALVVFVHYEIMGPQNDEKSVMKTTLVAAVVNIILNFILINCMEAVGAALATLISKIIFAGLCFWKVRKRIDGKDLLYRGLKYFMAAFIIVPVCLFVKVCVANSILVVLLSVFLSALSYFLLLWLLKDRYVREAVEKIMNRGF